MTCVCNRISESAAQYFSEQQALRHVCVAFWTVSLHCDTWGAVILRSGTEITHWSVRSSVLWRIKPLKLREKWCPCTATYGSFAWERKSQHWTVRSSVVPWRI